MVLGPPLAQEHTALRRIPPPARQSLAATLRAPATPCASATQWAPATPGRLATPQAPTTAWSPTTPWAPAAIYRVAALRRPHGHQRPSWSHHPRENPPGIRRRAVYPGSGNSVLMPVRLDISSSEAAGVLDLLCAVWRRPAVGRMGALRSGAKLAGTASRPR